MILTREAILQAQDIQSETVYVPEWGGYVIVRALNGIERDAWEAETYRTRGTNVELNMRNARARLLAMALVDEQGKRLFSDNASDLMALGGKAAKALDRLYDVARRLAGLAPEDIEELTKNSPSDQSGVSISV